MERFLITTFRTIWDGLDWTVLTDILLSIIPALICITLHELAHGFVAYKLGDMTAKERGRLTLNPIKHIDIFGLIMMVTFGFGWAKPVPVNMQNFKNPKRGMAITAMAGPVMNIFIACVVQFIYGLVLIPCMNAGGIFVDILNMISTTAYLSTMLAIFNLLPIPPLDGSKVLFSLLPDSAYSKLMRYERYGMILLLVIISTGIFSTQLSAAVYYVYDKLFIFAQAALELVLKFY